MKKTREECKQTVRQVAGEIIFSAKETLEEMLYENRHDGIDGINVALDSFKAALQNSFQSLNANDDKKNELGIDEKMMEDIRKLLLDSYLFEMESVLNKI